ncbi:MAG: PDZ domain-containing protein [Syntrophaceae bacterium]|nr:PDZ domain-containing protein [Syntrophaceae bacterium]
MRLLTIFQGSVWGLAFRRLAAIAVLAAFLYMGTGIVYNFLKIQLLRHRPASAAQAAAGQGVTVPSRELAEAYRIVAERNLFRTASQVIADEPGGGRGAGPDASLLADLRGTVAGDDGHGFAVIEEKESRKQRLVKVGDMISGAKVVRIKRNAVDVLVNGRVRTLKVAERRDEQLPPPAQAAAPTVPPGSGTIVVNRSEIEANLQDMGTMLRQAQVRPYFNAGVQAGFIVMNIQPGSFYQRLGILEGDVIQGVNGQNIRTAEDVMTLYNNLKDAPSMDLSVRRSGKEETLRYQFH